MFRTYALLSALCSFVYLVGMLVGVVLLFFNWTIALGVLVVSVICAPLAKVFDQKKFQEIYGTVLGRVMCDYEWDTGKQFALRDAAIHSAINELQEREYYEGF